MNILFVAAENGALAGGKVGGIGDVIRDLPPALATRGCRVTVVTPSHGFLHRGEGAWNIGRCRFVFRGRPAAAEVYAVAGDGGNPDVTQLVVDHPALSAADGVAGAHRIYVHDPPDRLFFADASRFALFSVAVAAGVSQGAFGAVDVIHLHDWHAALIPLLAEFHPDYAAVKDVRTVFSIHNLAFQGVRPFTGTESSLAAWFPELRYDRAAASDPRWPDCINPMAVGIRLADRIHTVSPSYAEEILQPDRKPEFYGGEGLEADLARVHGEGRLTGILNGCDYPPQRTVMRSSLDELLWMIRQKIIGWNAGAETVSAARFISFARTFPAAGETSGRHGGPEILLTGVGRVGEQKMLLLRHVLCTGKSALEAILEGIGPRGYFILLGSGDPAYERFLTDVSARRENFIFVNGYSNALAAALYASGDLFLMPSSFEPCGLSQMLAMRDGQPCVVHAVGGLKDTVIDGRNGFAFGGDTVAAQAERFVDTTLRAASMKRDHPAAWRKICENAAAARFTWADAARRCIRELYA